MKRNGFDSALILCWLLAPALFRPFAVPPMPVFIRFMRPIRSMISGWLATAWLIAAPLLLARLLGLTLVRSAVRHRDRHPDKLLDIAQERDFLPVAQRDGDAVGAGARGAADAVHIGFRHVRQVEVHDMADAVDVDAAGRDVGRDQRRAPAPLRKAASARSRWFCDLLPWIASAAMPARTRLRTTLSAPCLVRVKISARSTVSCRSTSTSVASLCRAIDADDRAARSCSTVVATGVTSTRHRIAQHVRGQIGDRPRHGRGEHQRLPLRRQLRDDFPDVVDEAHVEHAVGFVEHEELDAARDRSALLCTRSSRRPGVATRMSTPLSSARTCAPIDTPPIASADRRRRCRP